MAASFPWEAVCVCVCARARARATITVAIKAENMTISHLPIKLIHFMAVLTV